VETELGIGPGVLDIMMVPMLDLSLTFSAKNIRGYIPGKNGGLSKQGKKAHVPSTSKPKAEDLLSQISSGAKRYEAFAIRKRSMSIKYPKHTFVAPFTIAPAIHHRNGITSTGEARTAAGPARLIFYTVSIQKRYLNDPQAFAANKFASKVSI
jgi:hypothetical protein